MIRAAIAIALLAAGCSAPPTEWRRERPASPASAPSPPPVAASPSDPVSRADQIAAEAAAREAEYQHAIEDAKKPKTEVPVVVEFAPQSAEVPAYASGGVAPRPEEAWWRGQMEPLRQQWHQYADAAADANRRWNAAEKYLYGAERAAAVKKAIADQQRNSARATEVLRAINQLRDKAKQMNVPEEWVQWP